MQRIGILGISVGLVVSMFTPILGYGQEKFPNRPITVIINYGAGGPTDVALRLLGKGAEKKLGIPVVISNKPGGGGAVGTTELARSKPDGYTIGSLTIGAIAVVPLMQKVGYDGFRDFDYICGFGRYIYAIYTRTNSPLKSMEDVIETARKNPGKVTYGSMSPAMAVAMKHLDLKANIHTTYVPLLSNAETVTSVVGGHTELGIGSPDGFMPFVQNNEIRILAMATDQRWRVLPNVPTLKEMGYDIDLTGWMGLGGPFGIPKDRTDILFASFKVAHQDPEVKATLEKLWLDAPYITGSELKKIYQDRAMEWKPLLEALVASQPAKK